MSTCFAEVRSLPVSPPVAVLRVVVKWLDLFTLLRCHLLSRDFHEWLLESTECWQHLSLVTLSHLHISPSSIVYIVRQAETSELSVPNLHNSAMLPDSSTLTNSSDSLTRFFHYSSLKQHHSMSPVSVFEYLVHGSLRSVPSVCFVYCTCFDRAVCPWLPLLSSVVSRARVIAIGCYYMPKHPHHSFVKNKDQSYHETNDFNAILDDLTRSLTICPSFDHDRLSLHQLILDLHMVPRLEVNSHRNASLYSSSYSGFTSAVRSFIQHNVQLISIAFSAELGGDCLDFEHESSQSASTNDSVVMKSSETPNATDSFQCIQLEICLDSDNLYRVCSSVYFSQLTALNLGLELSIPGSSCEFLSPDSFSALASLPQLQVLVTAIQGRCDEYLYQISRLHSLASLHLSWFLDGGCPTHAASAYLKQLAHLEEFMCCADDGAGTEGCDDVFSLDALLYLAHLRYLDMGSMRYTGTYRCQLDSWTRMLLRSKKAVTDISVPSTLFPELSTLILVGVDSDECLGIDLTAKLVRMLEAWAESLRNPHCHITFAPHLQLLILDEVKDADIVRCLGMVPSQGADSDRRVVEEWIAIFPFRVIITRWESDYAVEKQRLAELRAGNQMLHTRCIRRGLLPWLGGRGMI